MRTLNDIVPPSRRKEMEPQGPAGSPREPLNLSGGRPSRFPYMTLLVVIIIIAVSIGALFYFSVAKVEVTPSSVSAAVQSSFTAAKSTGDLPYEIITAQKIATQSVKGSGTKIVSSGVSGPVTIFNTQSKPQHLIANTRFSTSAGLIFRIHSAVTVPAGTPDKPGSISAKAFADQPGATYNVPATSFTIPGFVGTPLATEVYARSSVAMTGGASGSVPVVDTVLESQTRSALKTALAPDLLASLQSQVPEGYVLLPGAASTTYQELMAAPSATTGQVDVKEQGTVSAVVFPNAALASAIAKSVAGLSYNGEPVMLSTTNNLLLAAQNLPDIDTQSFNFTVAGTASLIYSVDSSRIAAAVAGKTRQAAEVAVSNYPEVKRAIIILRPFWRQAFPKDPSAITVVEAKP